MRLKKYKSANLITIKLMCIKLAHIMRYRKNKKRPLINNHRERKLSKWKYHQKADLSYIFCFIVLKSILKLHFANQNEWHFR